MKILVVEDEKRLAKNIAQILKEKCGYSVDISYDGLDALHLIKTSYYDLIVLDLMLPNMDGLEVLSNIRTAGIKTSVLILTAKSSRDDIVKGLNTGSDDYLTKPFDIGELVARCKSLIRRTYDKPNPLVSIGALDINTLTKEVKVNKKSVVLTSMEYKTLEYLVFRKSEVVSKTELIEHLYSSNWDRYSNVIEVYVSSLRKKVATKQSKIDIKTHRGLGYMLYEK